MKRVWWSLAAAAVAGSAVVGGAGVAGAGTPTGGEVVAAAAGPYFEMASFTDPSGDSVPVADCRSDILSFNVHYRYDVLSLRTFVLDYVWPGQPSCWTSPDGDPSWSQGATNQSWFLDVNNDLQDDYVISVYNDGGVRAGVFDVRGGIDPVLVCSGSPEWALPTYGAYIDPTCIGDPATVRVQAYATYDESPFAPTCTCAEDVAPNGGFTDPIARKEFVPAGDGPAAASSGPGVVDVFARGQDNALWTQHLVSGDAGGWQSLGGIITGTPAAASSESGELDVFARGQDNALWTQHHDGTSWSGWHSLGGILTTPAAVVSSSPGTLDVFVAGNDQALYARHFDGTDWGGWVRLGGIITAAPAAVSSDPGVVDVFARGQDRALWTQHFAGAWSGWSSLGGIIDAAPSAASPSPGVVHVFARGQDDDLWVRKPDGWYGLDGQIAGPPAAVVAGSGEYYVFARGQDFALWKLASADGGATWGSWTSLGGIIR